MENLEEALRKANVNPDDLLEWLKSDTVYSLLRFGVKSPSSSGMDNYEGSEYYDLYNLVCALHK
jgi:hypothetical protein